MDGCAGAGGLDAGTDAADRRAHDSCADRAGLLVSAAFKAAYFARIAYAAAHVVPGDNGIDWEATLAFRRHLWSYGLGVAEAMDTSQRGMGFSWEGARELIARSLAEASGGLIACGAGTDQIPDDRVVTLDEIVAAYEEQCEFVESRGGRVILMASRALARTARSADDYGSCIREFCRSCSGR